MTQPSVDGETVELQGLDAIVIDGVCCEVGDVQLFREDCLTKNSKTSGAPRHVSPRNGDEERAERRSVGLDVSAGDFASSLSRRLEKQQITSPPISTPTANSKSPEGSPRERPSMPASPSHIPHAHHTHHRQPRTLLSLLHGEDSGTGFRRGSSKHNAIGDSSGSRRSFLKRGSKLGSGSRTHSDSFREVHSSKCINTNTGVGNSTPILSDTSASLMALIATAAQITGTRVPSVEDFYGTAEAPATPVKKLERPASAPSLSRDALQRNSPPLSRARPSSATPSGRRENAYLGGAPLPSMLARMDRSQQLNNVAAMKRLLRPCSAPGGPRLLIMNRTGTAPVPRSPHGIGQRRSKSMAGSVRQQRRAEPNLW